MAENEELSNYMARLQQYKQQIEKLEEQSELIQSAINDYKKSKITLEKMSELDDETEMLIPIGGRTFINVDVSPKHTSNVLFDIGSGVVTQKKTEDAVTKIDETIDALDDRKEQVSDMLEKLESEASELQNKAQQLYMQQQQG
ncbi:MAG: prefoldin subunit alpha [Candidatus Thermoplasmatota archaeon]